MGKHQPRTVHLLPVLGDPSQPRHAHHQGALPQPRFLERRLGRQHGEVGQPQGGPILGGSDPAGRAEAHHRGRQPAEPRAQDLHQGQVPGPVLGGAGAPRGVDPNQRRRLRGAARSAGPGARARARARGLTRGPPRRAGARPRTRGRAGVHAEAGERSRPLLLRRARGERACARSPRPIRKLRDACTATGAGPGRLRRLWRLVGLRRRLQRRPGRPARRQEE